MPHNLDLILTLTGGLAAALLLGFVTQKLKLSPIVGYLLAGVAVGPFTPGFVAHGAISEQFAELGVILLLFGVGLHFHLKELLAVRHVVLPGALVQIGLATAGGYLVTRAFGWGSGAAIVFGLSISIASTVVLLRVLSDADVLHTSAGHIAIGWLIVQDLVMVLVLVMLPILSGKAGGGGGTQELLMSAGLAVLKIALLVAFTLLVGNRVIPALLGYVAKTRSRELFTLTVLVLALGIAVGSAKLFGASMALGAFLAGMVVGQSEFATRAASEALPMRDAFAVLFFVSMGMLFDPAQVVPNIGLTAATLGLVLIGTPLVTLGMTLARGQSAKNAVSVALGMAQIGEFSFIVAALGRQLGLLPDRATQSLVAVSMICITLNPLIYRLAPPLSRWLDARLRRRSAKADEPGPPVDAAHRTVVIGYGPVGRTLSKLLIENQIEPTVIELNHETVNGLNKQGIRAIFGDATQQAVLEEAGVRTAGSLVFAASGSPDAVIRQARELNPKITIMARTTYVGEVASLRQAGAHTVVSAEGEVALAMAEHLLRGLGATGDQLDRERDRARAELTPG
ncbi:MAG: cation:proton antiporter [Polyangiaceae bacterium]|nr:cation:proton antiporter [Polyangiaceae bacterium]MCE7889087.1 sodium:proton exchanger [Sorangiineae bacterium PRO1]MCL4755578.1 cation:proton antiporter [Myxococcales bacterium]